MRVNISGTVTQRANRRTASGSFWGTMDEICVPATPARWTGWVYWSDTGVPFSTGPATVDAIGWWWDSVFEDVVETRATATVKLAR